MPETSEFNQLKEWLQTAEGIFTDLWISAAQVEANSPYKVSLFNRFGEAEEELRSIDKELTELIYYGPKYLLEEITNNLYSFQREAHEHLYLTEWNDFAERLESLRGSEIMGHAKSVLNVYKPKKDRPNTVAPILRYLSRIREHFEVIISYVSDHLRPADLIRQHPERYPYLISPNSQPQPLAADKTEPIKGLTAVQKLLFIRLLQEVGLFPKKIAGTDDAPELKAIGALVGLDYDTSIKGNKGAKSKVDDMLYDPMSITSGQVKHKIADLKVVEQIAKLLNVEPVLERIDHYRKQLIIIQNMD